MKVILTGGGTMGSVSPLLAIYDELKRRDQHLDLIFIGTKDGPEKAVVEAAGIKFFSISSGRLRRFFSLKNFTDPFKVFWGIHQAKKIIKDFHPDVVLTAGSYVSYGVAKAAFKNGVPVFIHQQDLEKGLANKLMEKFASIVTITFDDSLSDFNIKKTFFTSNPVSSQRFACEIDNAASMFGLDPELQTILVMGGGTGAQAINQLTVEALGELTKEFQVVHLTGTGKSMSHLIPDFFDRETRLRIKERYKEFEYVDKGMCELLKIATIVVTRAGVSSLTELAYLAKPSVVIPIPDSHQEKNARYFAKNNAVVALDQNELTGERFTKAVLNLAKNPAQQDVLKKNISNMIAKDAAKRYVDLVFSVVNKV